MPKLKIVNDNTEKIIPEQPIITYELVADLGEDGTKTVYECGSLLEVNALIDRIKEGDLDIPNIDLYEDELENLESLSVNIVLTAKELEIIQYDGEQSAMAELKTYKVEKD